MIRLPRSPAACARLMHGAELAKKRRDRRRDAQICIDQPDRGPAHAEVYKGGRCRPCYERK